MSRTKTLILSGYGLNCERETLFSCQRAGGEQVEVQHLSRLMNEEVTVLDYDFLVFIGGFLDGDDLGAGRVGANRWKFGQFGGERIQKHLSRFIESGKPVLGICNGFQLLVKLGVLPGNQQAVGIQEVSLTSNANTRFEDRWVRLKVDPLSRCLFTQGMDTVELPVRHGEGRLEASRDALLKPLVEAHQAPLFYTDSNAEATEAYPANPNGSPFGMAALCNPQGNVLGMMPHPEAYNHYTNHPQWTRRFRGLPPQNEDGAGLLFFKNAYQFLNQD